MTMGSLGKKKLSIFLPGLYGGGAERILLNLAEGFLNRGVLVDIVLAQNEGAFAKQIPYKANLVALRDSMRNSHRTITALPALVRYLKREHPDVLLTALHGNIIAVWAKLLSGTHTKLVLSEHNTFSMITQNMPAWSKWLNTVLVRLFYPKADEIVAVSQGVADDLAKTVKIDRRKIKVIYNPVINDTLFIKANRMPLHPWYKNDHLPIVIAIGRLTKQKDFPTLLEAFHEVIGKVDARLIILGEGEDRENLLQRVNDLNMDERVSLPGFVENPYAFLAHSTVFVLSSRWEGLPTVLVEAMACGIPVISTDCPSGPREILKDGKYGRLIPVGDPSALSSAILDGLGGKIPQAASEGWQEFTVKHTVDDYFSLLF